MKKATRANQSHVKILAFVVQTLAI